MSYGQEKVDSTAETCPASQKCGLETEVGLRWLVTCESQTSLTATTQTDQSGIWLLAGVSLAAWGDGDEVFWV